MNLRNRGGLLPSPSIGLADRSSGWAGCRLGRIMPGRRPEPLLGSACAIIPSDGSGRAVRPRDPTEPSFGFAEGDSTMTSAKTAVRSLVSGLLRETYTARAPLHLNLRGSRRAGMREAKASSQPRHLDLQRGGGGSGSGINGGSDRSGSADAKSSRTLARQHASMADGHAHAARNSRAADVISAHRDAKGPAPAGGWALSQRLRCLSPWSKPGSRRPHRSSASPRPCGSHCDPECVWRRPAVIRALT